ncbi:MAG: hypothetical protein ACKOMW_06730, partial [Actinomycetes bacterium]
MRKKNKFYLFLVIPIFVALFKEIPAKATSSDAITLESISAVSSTVLTGEDIVMQVQVAVPAGYSWDPNVTALGGKMTALFCPVNRYSEISGIGSCSFSGTNSNLYNLTTISATSVSTTGSFDFISFT